MHVLSAIAIHILYMMGRERGHCVPTAWMGYATYSQQQQCRVIYFSLVSLDVYFGRLEGHVRVKRIDNLVSCSYPTHKPTE